MAETNYKRLTRARARSTFAVAFMSRSSLWLGEDHLLGVDSNGYTETYKRFYFRDIQAITIRATKRRVVWNWILGILAAFCLARCNFGSLLKSQPDVQTIVFLCIAIFVFGIPLLLNNLFGRTCVCQLRTAVQVEELPSLCRVRQARKILEKIQPLIAAAQGQLTAEEVSLRMRETIPPVTATAQPAAPEISGAPPVIS
jgi:hypothetical protein